MKPGVLVICLVIIAGALVWIRNGQPPEPSQSSATVDPSDSQREMPDRPRLAPAAAQRWPTAEAATIEPSASGTREDPAKPFVLSDAQRQEMATQEHARIEKSHRVVYEDVPTAVGLNAEEFDALMEVLIYQQMNQHPDEGSSGGVDGRSTFNTFQQGRRDAVEALLGASRATAFADYERTLNARYEVLEMRQALGRAGIPLTARQRETVIASAIERGAYSPPLSFNGNARDAEYQRILAQEALRDQKMLSVAQGILTSAQYAEYERYQGMRRAASEATTFPEREQQATVEE